MRRLPASKLKLLAAELRDYLVQCVPACGGHFAAGLGAVELTIALHYIFDTPADRLVWDVGHQCYPHKILTGCRSRMASIRRKGGLAPFLTPDESDYDLLAFGTTLEPALQAAERFDATVVNMRFVKPLDAELVLALAAAHDVLITVEENVVAGGAGSAVNECLAANGVRATVVNLGLPDRFTGHGTRDELLAEAGLDRDGIAAVIERYCSVCVSRLGAVA